MLWTGNGPKLLAELWQTTPFRGSKSRNKVSVGEPAEGSLKSCGNRGDLYW